MNHLKLYQKTIRKDQ